MGFSEIWFGDWRGRARSHALALGFSTVTKLAEARPGVSVEQLTEELQPDVAISQVTRILAEEGEAAGNVSRAVQDLFLRSLRDALPDGWSYPLDDARRVEVVNAITLLLADLEPYIDHDGVVPAMVDFLETKIPDGWRPEEASDRFLADLVKRCLKPEFR